VKQQDVVERKANPARLNNKNKMAPPQGGAFLFYGRKVNSPKFGNNIQFLLKMLKI
jgi:hypothetical protein